jgi:hypothetical protein
MRFSHKLSSVKSHCLGKKNLFNIPKNTLRFKKSAKTRCYKGNYQCHKRILNVILTSMLLVRKPGFTVRFHEHALKQNDFVETGIEYTSPIDTLSSFKTGEKKEKKAVDTTGILKDKFYRNRN